MRLKGRSADPISAVTRCDRDDRALVARRRRRPYAHGKACSELLNLEFFYFEFIHINNPATQTA